MSSVISFKEYLKRREEAAYRQKILKMSKPELMNEMVSFQERYKEVGYLTKTMMTQGIHLFERIEQTADTSDLKVISKAYAQHLKDKLKSQGGSK